MARAGSAGRTRARPRRHRGHHRRGHHRQPAPPGADRTHHRRLARRPGQHGGGPAPRGAGRDNSSTPGSRLNRIGDSADDASGRRRGGRRHDGIRARAGRPVAVGLVLLLVCTRLRLDPVHGRRRPQRGHPGARPPSPRPTSAQLTQAYAVARSGLASEVTARTSRVGRCAVRRRSAVGWWWPAPARPAARARRSVCQPLWTAHRRDLDVALSRSCRAARSMRRVRRDGASSGVCWRPRRRRRHQLRTARPSVCQPLWTATSPASTQDVNIDHGTLFVGRRAAAARGVRRRRGRRAAQGSPEGVHAAVDGGQPSRSSAPVDQRGQVYVVPADSPRARGRGVAFDEAGSVNCLRGSPKVCSAAVGGRCPSRRGTARSTCQQRRGLRRDAVPEPGRADPRSWPSMPPARRNCSRLPVGVPAAVDRAATRPDLALRRPGGGGRPGVRELQLGPVGEADVFDAAGVTNGMLGDAHGVPASHRATTGRATPATTDGGSPGSCSPGLIEERHLRGDGLHRAARPRPSVDLLRPCGPPQALANQYACSILADGTVFIAGADGYVIHAYRSARAA